MSFKALIYRRALAMLWSAGHAPSSAQRSRMEHDARAIPLQETWPVSESAFNEAASRLLAKHGYLADPSKPYDQALPETQSLGWHRPRPGDAVRLVGDRGWFILPKGEIMTLSSCDAPGRLRIGKGGHYRTEKGSVSLSAGGPSSARGLRTEVLGKTDEFRRMEFWRFHQTAEANGGVYFSRPARVWTWDGDEAGFSDPIGMAA